MAAHPERHCLLIVIVLFIGDAHFFPPLPVGTVLLFWLPFAASLDVAFVFVLLFSSVISRRLVD